MIRPRGGPDNGKGMKDGRLAQVGRPFLIEHCKETKMHIDWLELALKNWEWIVIGIVLGVLSVTIKIFGEALQDGLYQLRDVLADVIPNWLKFVLTVVILFGLWFLAR
jgi:hypothetical protein